MTHLVRACDTEGAFNAQKLSVAVQYSAALEIAHALRMPTTGDGRSNPGAVACAVM